MFFLSDLLNRKVQLPTESDALPGRAEPLPTSSEHFVNHRALKGPFPDGLETAFFGMGCFWGVERLFWQIPGVHVTAAGYQGGVTPNPTYQETCTGMTGHTEVVMVVFDPKVVSYAELLKVFWENHDPTQGMRQGNDVGSTYRSAIYTTGEAQMRQALASRDAYQQALEKGRYPRITTEIREAPEFFYAEAYHQQYLAKNPGGYCNLRGTGIACVGQAAETATAG